MRGSGLLGYSEAGDSGCQVSQYREFQQLFELRIFGQKRLARPGCIGGHEQLQFGVCIGHLIIPIDNRFRCTSKATFCNFQIESF